MYIMEQNIREYARQYTSDDITERELSTIGKCFKLILA